MRAPEGQHKGINIRFPKLTQKGPLSDIPMSYTITVRVYYRETTTSFYNTERTVWDNINCQWKTRNDILILFLDKAGTSGALRYVAPETGETLFVVLGVNTGEDSDDGRCRRWCDIRSDLGDNDTSSHIQPKYYGDVPNEEHVYRRREHRMSRRADNRQRRKFWVKFYGDDEHNCDANIYVYGCDNWVD